MTCTTGDSYGGMRFCLNASQRLLLGIRDWSPWICAVVLRYSRFIRARDAVSGKAVCGAPGPRGSGRRSASTPDDSRLAYARRVDRPHEIADKAVTRGVHANRETGVRPAPGPGPETRPVCDCDVRPDAGPTWDGRRRCSMSDVASASRDTLLAIESETPKKTMQR